MKRVLTIIDSISEWSGKLISGFAFVFTYPLFFIFIGLLFWFGLEIGVRAFELKQTVSPSPWASPLWPVKLSIPLAAFLMLLQGLADYIRILNLAFTGKEL